jgi:hypothetical protein
VIATFESSSCNQLLLPPLVVVVVVVVLLLLLLLFISLLHIRCMFFRLDRLNGMSGS